MGIQNHFKIDPIIADLVSREEALPMVGEWPVLDLVNSEIYDLGDVIGS